MPLYNAEKYLVEALQSILRQTYKNFEVICINDASTDTTLDILCQFQSSDCRIKIFSNNERLGAAISRNRGIHEAKGKYITFLDGDDVFEEELLQSAYDAMEKYDVDIVMYEFKHVPSEYVNNKKYIQRSDVFREKYCKKTFSILENKPIDFMYWSSAPWNKLYKKSFIYSNQLKFQSLSCCNDVYFVNMALMLAEEMIMLDDRRVMIYVRDHEETTRISYDRDPMCLYLAMEKLGNELVNRGLFTEVFQHYYYRLFYLLRVAILNVKKREKAKNFYNYLQIEGIRKLADLCQECYQKTDRYIHDLLENFCNLEFSTSWYIKETVFTFHLYNNIEKVVALFHYYLDCNIRIVIWGVGKNGKIFLDFLKRNNLKVDYVVDRDEEKYGSEIEGYYVKKPEDVIKEGQVVIVFGYSIYKEIVEELKGVNVEIIELGKVIGIN